MKKGGRHEKRSSRGLSKHIRKDVHEEETRESDMATQQANVPPSIPVTSGTAKAFEDLRSKFNAALDEITRAAPEGAKAQLGIRCGGGCHEGVIE
jgi:hypothetical protein